MTKFLFGKKLSKKIKQVVRGGDLRCAVAFWGFGVVQELFETDTLERKDVRIICDLSMGGTNPATLRALGAPFNNKIKYLDGLHAKVYISNVGAVIGSANASRNGIGFDGAEAGLIEAGTYVAPETQSWIAINEWFEFLDFDAKIVKGYDLTLAQSFWDRRIKSVQCNYQNKFLDYVPKRHGLVYVLWYGGGGGFSYSNAAVSGVDANENRNVMHVSGKDIDMRGSWIICFQVNGEGLAHGRVNPYLFYADTLIPHGVIDDPGYEYLLGQNPMNSYPNAPFDLSNRMIVEAFRSIINTEKYEDLRGKNNSENWLAKDHVNKMTDFWHDVKCMYEQILNSDH